MKIKSLVLIIIGYVRELYNISLLPIIYEPYGYITLQEEKNY